jgi:3-oxoacyl-[acyl-carrier protein] reductase
MNILITGGASGIGIALTEKIAQNKDYKIFATYCRSEIAAKELSEKYPNVEVRHCDYTLEGDLKELCLEIKDMDLDVLVNNALCGLTKNHFHKIKYQEFSDSFKHNVLSTISVTQKAIQLFRKKRSGKIITLLTSFVVSKPPLGLSEYIANKSYLLSMSKSWASENSAFNIISNCISPSFIQTPLNKSVDERVIEQMVDEHPLKRLLTSEEVAESVCYLIEASAHINGQNLILNAGEGIVH